MRARITPYVLTLAIMVVACSQRAGPQAAGNSPGAGAPKAAPAVTSPLKLKVESVEVGTKFLAYVGGGANISPPDTLGGGEGIPLISISNGSSFLAGEVSSRDGKAKIIKITFSVGNPTAQPLSFKIGDVALATGGAAVNDFAAVGYGSKLCAMSEADRKAVKEIVVEVPTRGTRELSFAFPLDPADVKTGELMLRNAAPIAFAMGGEASGAEKGTPASDLHDTTPSGGCAAPSPQTGGPNRQVVSASEGSSLWREKEDTYFQYLRFYSDGSVLGVSSPSSPAEVQSWFKAPYENSGKYTITGSEIKFSLTSPRGTVDYDGVIEDTSLQLSTFSHINNKRFCDRFQRIAP